MTKRVKRMLQKLGRKIRADNTAFEKMTPAQKRVVIAQDTLDYIEGGKLLATVGRWIDDPAGRAVLGDRVAVEAREHPDKQLQELLEKMPKCNVCGVGALFYSACRRADDLTLDEFLKKEHGGWLHEGGGSTTFTPYLRRFFTNEQLEDVEAAFERGGGVVRHLRPEAEAFAAEVDDPTERLRLIMENIVANKGKFVPSKRPVTVTPGFEEARR